MSTACPFCTGGGGREGRVLGPDPGQTTTTVVAKQIAMPRPREGKAITTVNRPRADARWLYALPLVSLAIQLKITDAAQERAPGVWLTNRDGSLRYHQRVLKRICLSIRITEGNRSRPGSQRRHGAGQGLSVHKTTFRA